MTKILYHDMTNHMTNHGNDIYHNIVFFIFFFFKGFYDIKIFDTIEFSLSLSPISN